MIGLFRCDVDVVVKEEFLKIAAGEVRIWSECNALESSIRLEGRLFS